MATYQKVTRRIYKVKVNKRAIKEKFRELIDSLIYARDQFTTVRRKHQSVPEKQQELKKLYEKHVGRPLDWNNLTSYTEKMQWAKLFFNPEIKTVLSDKYQVRQWIKDRIGEEYLIPLIGVWEDPEDIDFEALPDSFVLKPNSGSGNVEVVPDKSKINERSMKRRLRREMNKNFAYNMYEMHYEDIEPLIIGEKYMTDKSGMLNDYKFLCFDGKPYYCWVDTDRYGNHHRNIYDLNWHLQDWELNNYGLSEEPVAKPENFDEMLEVVKNLCRDFTHVRVDLYNRDGEIFFGEMTFTNASGFAAIYPQSMDEYLGDLWKLNMDK